MDNPFAARDDSQVEPREEDQLYTASDARWETAEAQKRIQDEVVQRVKRETGYVIRAIKVAAAKGEDRLRWGGAALHEATLSWIRGRGFTVVVANGSPEISWAP
jgi:hypothetical protein